VGYRTSIRATITLDIRNVTRCAFWAVRTIRHKGLRHLHEEDNPRGVIGEHIVKLRDILARLDAAQTVADAAQAVAEMDMPGFNLHPLKGEMRGFWAITVRANWRVIFRFADREVFDVDYVDYH